MATSSRSRGNGPVLRSLSPSDSFGSHAPLAPVTAFASSTFTFFDDKRVPPTRVTVASRASPGRTYSAMGHSVRNQTAQPQKRACSCSPTTHKGSFRCGLHKGFDASSGGAHAPSSPINRLHAVRRSAMTNSLVRICGVEGELVKRALASLIRPSSHSQRRKNNFKPRPSGLSVMSKANS